MTSFAFILGVVPLMLAHGAGQEGRHSIATTVFGGMIMATELNLFFIPVLTASSKAGANADMEKTRRCQ
jgi:multidrug efflux pump subunit AcrB